MIDAHHTNFERVMIIDDNLIDLYIAARMITKSNFGEEVLQFTSANEAINYLQKNQDNKSRLPDVIFVDIYMPGMSGFEFMEAFDKLPSHLKKHCMVFVISSSIDERDVSKAKRDKNIVDMVEKPINRGFLNAFMNTYSIPVV